MYSPILCCLLLSCMPHDLEAQSSSPPAPTSLGESSYQWKTAPIDQTDTGRDQVKFIEPRKLSPHVLNNYASIELREIRFKGNVENKIVARVKRCAETDAFLKALSTTQFYRRRFVNLRISSSGCMNIYFLDAEGKDIASYTSLVDFLDCFEDEKGHMRPLVAEFASFLEAKNLLKK